MVALECSRMADQCIVCGLPKRAEGPPGLGQLPMGANFLLKKNLRDPGGPLSLISGGQGGDVEGGLVAWGRVLGKVTGRCVNLSPSPSGKTRAGRTGNQRWQRVNKSTPAQPTPVSWWLWSGQSWATGGVTWGSWPNAVVVVV